MSRALRLALIFSFSLASLAALAQQDFSGEVVDGKGADNNHRTKIYATKDKLRFEPQDQSEREHGVMIVDLAKQTSAVLMPERKMYMVFPSSQSPAAQRTWHLFRITDAENACSEWQKLPHNENGTCKKIGSETVNGRSTVKYEGTNDKGETGQVWIDPKIGFPIKWQGKDGGGELQNIKEGSQPSSLFEIPSDYQKFQMPAGMQNMQRPH